jgi:hypothetical protein
MGQWKSWSPFRELLTPLVLALGSLLLFGSAQRTPENDIYFQMAVFSVVPSWAYWYWRIDAKRFFTKLQRAFQC